MKYLLFFLISVCAISAFSQTKITSIKKVADGLYIMYYDTTAEKHIVTKSTIVEFSDHIVLIEMPISNDGAGTVHLKDHTEGGETVLAKLKEAFPTKPLTYVLSSHWHPHSISSIVPFISKGITVVTTRKNFKRLSEFVDSATYKKYQQYITFVDQDSLILKDNFNSIIAYKFDKEDYPNVPTEDFLYFQLPKYNYLHTSCMYQRLQGRLVKGKEMISSRVEDLAKFIRAKHITPRYVITTDTYWDDPIGMASGDSLEMVLDKGIGMSTLEQELLTLSMDDLTLRTDSVIKSLMANAIPYSILNRAVYTSLARKDLKKALALARVQALLIPSDPNSWDTYGEVYYFLGEMELAKKYEAQCRRIDKSFTVGGEQTWKKDLEEYKAKWAKLGK